MKDPQIKNKPECKTENCNNPAMGILNGKWRCGKCIQKYQENLRKIKENLFITENANIN